MTATVTTISTLGSNTFLDIDIDSVQTATSTVYSWLNGDGDLITLLGSFNYPNGTSSLPSGTVAQIKFDQGNNSTTDMYIEFDAPENILAALLSNDADIFWDAALGESDTFYFSNPGKRDSGFGADGITFIGNHGTNDIINSADEAHISGDFVYVTDGFIGGADTIILGAGANYSYIYGDARNIVETTTSVLRGGNDIIDASAIASTFGTDRLFGDFGYVYSSGHVLNTGVDTITGGANDVLIVGDVATLFGNNITLNAQGDILTGGANHDVIVGDVYESYAFTTGNIINAGSDTIHGGDGDDRIYGDFSSISTATINNGHDLLYGDAGDDLIFGQSGDDSLYGGEGNDYLNGGVGDDILDGGVGNDIADFSDGLFSATVTLGLAGADGSAVSIDGGTDILRNIEIVIGSGASDTITGNELDNTIEGGEGNDILDGGAGTLDIVSFASATSGVTVNLDIQGSMQNFGALGMDTISNFEGVIGGSGDDTFIAVSSGFYIDGGDGVDTLDLRSLGGTSFVDFLGVSTVGGMSYTLRNIENILLPNGTTTFYGSEGDDIISTAYGNHNDVLWGRGGTDTMTGGLGDDVYIVDSIDIVVEYSGEGTDTVYTSRAYTLHDNVEIAVAMTAGDDLIGNSLDNVLIATANYTDLSGMDGNDVLYGSGFGHLSGGAGNDVLVRGDSTYNSAGGTGDDTYIHSSYAAINITENAGEGMDTVYAAADYTMADNLEILVLLDPNSATAGINGTGNAENNTIIGNGGNNIIIGMSGADFIIGGAGNDTIAGGEGLDTLQGNTGYDVFIYNSLAEAGDIIQDWIAADDAFVFGASAFGFTAGETLVDGVNFISGLTPGAVSAQATFLWDSDDTNLFYDADGTGGTAAILVADLQAFTDVTVADIAFF